MGTRSARKRRRLMRDMVRHEHSAGGVVVRPRDDGTWEVLLISTHEGARWSLPKGHVEHDETAEQAAVREVFEETGVQASLIQPLDTIEYWFRWRASEGSVLVHKKVTFYLMRYVRGSEKNHGWEVDEARWFPFTEALQRVSYDDERKLLVKALQILEQDGTTGEHASPRVPAPESKTGD